MFAVLMGCSAKPLNDGSASYRSAAAAAASASSLPLMLPLTAGASLLSSRRAK